MSKKYKQGEKEAKIILENFGFNFDDSYYDDNSQNSMADLKTLDNKFVEITHTKHNNNVLTPNNFQKKPFEEQQKIYQEIQNICNKRKDKEKLTPSEIKKLKTHFGTKDDYLGSEFKCDSPMIEFSVDNIIREIKNDKGEKYKNKKNISLFCFVTEDELNLLLDLLKQKNNKFYDIFINTIKNSPFEYIYLCEWNFSEQNYNVIDPRLLCFSKIKELKLKSYNIFINKNVPA